MPQRNRALIISSLVHAYSHACILSLPPLLLLLRDEFSTSLTMISFLITCSGLLFGIGALPFGALSDKIGALKVHLIGTLMAIASCIGIYFSFNLLSLSFFLMTLGLASSTYHPSAFKFISSSFPKNIGRAFGINGMIGNIGQIGAPITSAFIAYNWGWRPVFIMLMAFGVFLSLLLFFIRGTEVKNTKSGKIKNIKLKKEFILIILVTMTAGLAYRGTTTMLPTYTALIFGKDTFQSGALVTLMLTTGGVSQLIAGEINDRYGTAYPLMMMSLACLLSIVVILFAPYYIFIVCLMVFGFAYFAVNLYTNTLIGSITEKELRGTFYGITFLSRFGLGFIAPFIIGFISDLYSISYLFYIILAFILVFILLVTMLSRWISRCHVPMSSDTPPE